ncbi:hypothetical protein BGW36DRAFT_429550 [Talaromyces proteolyticus]|uniref:NACHT domain-containing protein n=1 Tax=Talaromyces proteolyticus TaxID=1131652 RepID=A0AAD4KS39_9EURO|nr:uncharacterized protein BGW36DRAFT_429550 [Talaromyces proteolyticus]KAH8695691.1 hypothetical protein BGW36DRAFT_429550 [Talaromyces proteolyticus]
MTSSATENGGVRRRLRQRWNQLRGRSRSPSNDMGIYLPQNTQTGPSLATNPISSSRPSAASALPLNQANTIPRESTNIGDDEAQIQTDQITAHWDELEQRQTAGGPIRRDAAGSVIVSSNLWSAAYREAVESLGEEIDVAILKGENVAQLFTKLEEIDKDVTQESAFVRGVRYLHSIQKPLETFKQALDLASPLANLEPTASTVVGVVRSVTTIIISFATADADFASQITEMRDQISYIDDCDTLGQKVNKKDIHKALVLVYQKLLEFYKVAFETLTRKGAKLIMKIILENDRLPNIVQEFLKYSESLRKLLDKATLEIMEEMRTMLYHDRISGWLGGDKLLPQDQYHNTLQDLRANEACDFLLSNTNFTNWYHASDSQQLAIVGPMGCGKTVAVTFLVDELRRRSEDQVPKPKICTYYCRDDETGQAVYIFSALILSLLNQLPGLKRPFFEWYDHALTSGMNPAASSKKLEEFLQRLLESVDRPIFIIIDGLDECGSASQIIVLEFLKILSQKILGLKTILSFRPQEEILEQLDVMPRIDLGSDVQRDRIIVEKTVETQLARLSTNVKALVIKKLSSLAQGNAIWTKMIVELIKVKKIMAANPMERFLEDIPLPGMLTDLYVTLLSRCTSNDPESLDLAWIALKLLSISRRPLSILELAWAVALGAAQHVSTVAALDRLVDHQRVMSFIHPFIAPIDFNDLKKRQVRLVHQSVKEFAIEKFVIKEGPALNEGDKMILRQRRVENLEAFTLDICIKYLLLDDIGNRDLFSEEQVAIAELPQESNLFNDSEEPVEYDPYCTWESWEENMIRYDPTDRGFGEFFVYASCYWLKHFGAIKAEPLPGLASIESLCQAGSTRLHNWIQQNCRPGCAINPRFQFDSNLYDPLSITSLYGSEAMLRYMLENSDFDNEKFLRNPAMEAADQILQWGELSMLRILFLEDRFCHQLQTLDFFHLLIKNWSNPRTNRDNWDIAFDLVDYVSDKMVQEQWCNELLSMATGAGCTPIIQRLPVTSGTW